MNSRQDKMSLLFIIDFIHTTSGGTENQLLKLIYNLPDDKYDLSLVFLRNTEWITRNEDNLPGQLSVFNFRKLLRPRSIVNFIRLILHIKHLDPDLVVTFFPLSNIIGVCCAKIAQAKNIISTRRDFGLWLNIPNRLILPIVNKFVKIIITNSKPVAQLVIDRERAESSRVKVIYNGLEIRNQKIEELKTRAVKDSFGADIHSPVIGILANLRQMKRHTTFIEAARRVIPRMPESKFVVIGDGPLMKPLKEMVLTNKLEHCISFVGNQTDIPLYLSALDIGVNCSQNEGLSNAIMEYMAYGVPCIVSEAGGNTDLIENGINGYTFELDNADQLADLIIDLIENPDKREMFVKKSEEKIHSMFTMEQMIANYDHLFTRVVGGLVK